MNPSSPACRATATEKLGLEDTADSSKVLAAARDSVARWRSFANSRGTSDLEERITRLVYRSFERLAGEPGAADHHAQV